VVQLQAKDKRAKWIQTQAGEVQVKREYYYCEVCGTGFFPSDEQMGLVEGLYSAGLYDPVKRVVLNQGNSEENPNEIGAAPTVLKDLDLRGQLVTGEALVTQRELSKLIIEAAGDSLGLVKDNQPTRRADIERLLAPEQVPLGAALGKPIFNLPSPFTKRMVVCTRIP
jgi:hypothetical protein